ncbi:unnamed protein product [Rotaria magnacalcarata]|uniref:U-box domain-containing protein n=1 Tax=Rotaria magnacalcarata TaxID=392030 RepID=A0A814SVZ6_9BILA|nr:unnamed protein product [Rotaria magnacalcarata]CAF1532533.1 unnamed protein product [Rotaria magnacalcarata]CAF2225748.1 unnamed protein product [Rotaria magnacalcarata]CAF3785311.1 unnamed protein product [Rotaria magnacalcarata]CAF3847455.1 unnamed protein product [Rotaria magnacalcarata]
MMLELLDEAESEHSNAHNPHRARESELVVCEFCPESFRQDLLHQHKVTCPQNPARARVRHERPNIQHPRRPPPPPPHEIPPRVHRPPPTPPRPIRSQSQRVPTSTLTPIPDALLCPITSDIFKDPVLAEDGHTYERQAIVQWIRQEGTSPITREPLSEKKLRRNHTIRKLVDELHLNS